ncbi:MAG: c-type cytochrome [Betaproteobacteria bacterium]|nr:c-type cytochrome [Betaproteobacteria bacterium]
MVKRLLIAAVMAILPAGGSAAVPEQPKGKGIESRDYRWNELTGEEAEALRRKGDAQRGRQAYEVCQGCHRPDGSGRPDGAYPQLAGQHATVLIKQMTDIRAGTRDNPKMYPFSTPHVINVQEIADIAVYLEGLAIPRHNAKGPGADLERGRSLYDKDCKTCHGANGEGNAAKFYPVLAGQHYPYLVRQARDIRDGKRRNANPKMVKAVKGYSDGELEAVSDYMSRLALAKKRKPAK